MSFSVYVNTTAYFRILLMTHDQPPLATKPEKSEVKGESGRGFRGAKFEIVGSKKPNLLGVQPATLATELEFLQLVPWLTASVLRYQVDHCLSLSTSGNQPR